MCLIIMNPIVWLKEEDIDILRLFSWPPRHSWLDHITQYVSLPRRILLASFCVFLNLVCFNNCRKGYQWGRSCRGLSEVWWYVTNQLSRQLLCFFPEQHQFSRCESTSRAPCRLIPSRTFLFDIYRNDQSFYTPSCLV
jgi:hypothetical protein